MELIVDVDDMNSWPGPAKALVQELADRCRGKTLYTPDLPFELTENDPSLRRALSGCLVRAFHCTRLLDHEVASIQGKGLRLLTAELLDGRIAEARATGALSDALADVCENHAFKAGDARHRANQVCLVLSRSAFHHSPDGCVPLLATWGGEGIYMQTPLEIRGELERIGRPAVVSALLDLSDDRHYLAPGLLKVFVGSVLGLEDAAADVFYRSAIPPEHIEAIWLQGDPEFPPPLSSALHDPYWR